MKILLTGGNYEKCNFILHSIVIVVQRDLTENVPNFVLSWHSGLYSATHQELPAVLPLSRKQLSLTADTRKVFEVRRASRT